MSIAIHMSSLLFFHHSLYNIKVMTQKIVLLDFLVKYHNSHTPQSHSIILKTPQILYLKRPCWQGPHYTAMGRFKNTSSDGSYLDLHRNILWIKEETSRSKLHWLAASATLPSIAASLAAWPSVYFWLKKKKRILAQGTKKYESSFFFFFFV